MSQAGKKTPRAGHDFSRRRRYLRLWVFSVLCFLFGCSSAAPREAPVARNGVIDMSSWNFKTDGNLDLEGEWKFAWMRSSPDFTGAEYDDSSWDTFRVPAMWNARTGTGFGYAWFRLRITHLTGTNLGLYLKHVARSYALYVNGILLMQNGKPGLDAASTVHQRLPLIVPLPDDATEVVLAWNVANFSEYIGGPNYSIRMGDIQSINNEVWSERTILFFAIGFILMMAVYHVILWFGRRGDVLSLFLAASCLLIAARMLVMNDYMSLLFPGNDLFELIAKLEFIINILAWFFLQNFFLKLFPAEFSKTVYRVLFVVMLLVLLFVAVTPVRIFAYLFPPFEAFLLVAGGVVVAAIVLAVKRRRPGAPIVLCGFIVLFLTIINDIIFTNAMAATIPLIHFGLLGLLISQSAVLSARFAHAHLTAEHLSENLRHEVEAQTRTISRKNEELVRASEERTDFFVNLAHETKTPLTLICNYVNRYAREKGRDADLAVILENVQKLKTDMVNFLDHEKLRKGQVFYDHDQVVNVSAVLEKRLVLFREAARERHIGMIGRIEPELCVRMDPFAFDRVINNLLENAVRYTGEMGDIHVELTQEGGLLRLTVKDSGIGIPAEQQANIFKPYYQMTHKKRNTQGIGMGLSIVKQILDGTGGRIELESAPGRGSAFTVILARCIPSAGEAVEQAGDVTRGGVSCSLEQPIATADGPGRFDRTLLVVEDNRRMLSFLVDALKASYRVAAAENGRQALEQLSAGLRPDLIVSDIMMDEMDGYELFHRLMEDPRNKGIPFVFLTARTGQEEKLRALSRGIVDCIPKPFDVDEVVARIGALLKLKDAQRQAGAAEVETRILDAIHGRTPAGEPGFLLNERCRSFGITNRERDILELLLSGKEDKEIGQALCISYHTVRSHIGRIYKKTKVQNKIELMNFFK